MSDLLYLVVTLGFFFLSIGFIAVCDRLMERSA
jgi:hypothetical protein